MEKMVKNLEMRSLEIKSLPEKGWIDKDEQMLHACFQLLEDAIEQEGVDDHANYKAHKDFVDEVRKLYNWWQVRKNDNSSFDSDKYDDEMLLRLMKIRTQLWT